MSARHVVLATGGQSVPKTGSDGFGYALAAASWPFIDTAPAACTGSPALAQQIILFAT